jgi:hypothetical protein
MSWCSIHCTLLLDKFNDNALQCAECCGLYMRVFLRAVMFSAVWVLLSSTGGFFFRRISFFTIIYPCLMASAKWYRIKMLKIKVNTK